MTKTNTMETKTYKLVFDLRFNLQNFKIRKSYCVKFLKYPDIPSKICLQTE